MTVWIPGLYTPVNWQWQCEAWFRIHCRIFPNPLSPDLKYFSPPNNIFLQARQRKNRKFSHKGRSTVKETVSRDGYFFLKYKHFYQYFLCMCWWFSRTFKSSPLLYTIIKFYFLLLNYYLFWIYLLKPSSEFPSLWLFHVLECRALIGCKESAQQLTC